MNNYILYSYNLKDGDIESLTEVFDQYGNVSTHIKLKFNSNQHCPICHHHVAIHDYRVKTIKHSQFVDSNSTIVFHHRRVKCKSCSHVFFEPNPFAEIGKKSSHLLIKHILSELRKPNVTYTSLAKDVNVSPSFVINVFDTHVRIPRNPLPKILCMDEIHTRVSSYDSSFACVLLDWSTNQIVDILPSRRKGFLSSYFTKYHHECDSVKYLSIDMWLPYKEIAQLYFKNCIICVDSFHVIEHIMKVLNKVKLRIKKSFSTSSNEYYLLSKFEFLFMKYDINLNNEGKYNKRFKRVLTYNDLFKMICEIDDSLNIAIIIKDQYIHFNRTCDREHASSQLLQIVNLIDTNLLPEFEEIKTMLQNWHVEIVNSFTIINGRRISNGPIEGVNNKIRTLTKNANGYVNFERMRNRIMYVSNKNTFCSLTATYESNKKIGKSRGSYKASK